MIQFETERLKINRFREDQLELLYPLHSDPEVMRYIRTPPGSWDEFVQGFADAAAYMKSHPEYGIFPAFLKSSGEFIGWGLLVHFERNPQKEIEVGYRLHRKFWGQGYATEIGQALLNYGYKQLGLKKIVAVTHPENHGSQNVLRKLGLKPAGETKHYGQTVTFFIRDAK